jgi:hypothetical protein
MKRPDLRPGVVHRSMLVVLLVPFGIFTAVVFGAAELGEPGYWLYIVIWVLGARTCFRWPFLGVRFEPSVFEPGVLVVVGEGLTRRIKREDIERAEVVPTVGLIPVKQMVIVRKGSASPVRTPVIDHSRSGSQVEYAVRRVNTWLEKGPGGASSGTSLK